MRALVAAAALAVSLIAVQAQAASYNFTFADTLPITPAGVESGTSAVATDAALTGLYTFTLDTSQATRAAGPTAPTVFSNVSIFLNGVQSGTDTIKFAGAAQGTVDGNEVLTATGSYNFSFDPAPASGNGTAINFATGVTTGTDATNSSSASLGVTASAVSAAPEPGAWALMLGGVGAMGLRLRRRRSAALTA